LNSSGCEASAPALSNLRGGQPWAERKGRVGIYIKAPGPMGDGGEVGATSVGAA